VNENELLAEIQKVFAASEPGRLFFARQNLMLEEKHGFTPDNTRFAEGGCCDEINEPELQMMEQYWGERFKFGGLAGYCHAGKTGLGAVSHHVPEVEGNKNLLLVAGAHIGYHDGQWGKVPRPGQPGITTSCGSLVAVLSTGYDTIKAKAKDPLDRQQETVEEIMLPYLEKCKNAGQEPDVVDATHFLMGRIDADMQTMANELSGNFDGQIALITGVTINTELGNFFCPVRVEVF
jgi:hypothetical protein